MTEPEKTIVSTKPAAPCSKPHLLYKCLLNQQAQKLRVPLPAYQTHNEGTPHQPKFRSTVFINSESYTSPNTFQLRKSAEMDASRVAFFAIMQKSKNEAIHLVREDKGLCKSILNEYAARIDIEKPVYQTNQLEAAVPIFCSTLFFNGVSYTGDTARSKKDAEQLAARAVILKCLDTETGHVMSEVIHCRFRHYAEMNKVKGISNDHVGNIADNNVALKEPESKVRTINMANAPAITEPSLVQGSTIPAYSLPQAVIQQPIPAVSSLATAPVLSVQGSTLPSNPLPQAVIQQPIPAVFSQATSPVLSVQGSTIPANSVPLDAIQQPISAASFQTTTPVLSVQGSSIPVNSFPQALIQQLLTAISSVQRSTILANSLPQAVTQQPIPAVSSQETTPVLSVSLPLAQTPFSGTNYLPISCALSAPCSEQIPDVPATHLSSDVTQPPNSETLSGTVDPLALGLIPGVTPAPSKKRKRKNKKKSEKRMDVDAPLQASAGEVAPCSVAQ